jgi:aspartyl-tRNA(Asn)/glutamyl-tRNA(Gln) amidotransferase subunit A
MDLEKQNRQLYTSVEDLVGRFKARELSPVEAMQLALQRAKQSQETVNAFSVITEDDALAAARAAERAVMRGDALGPLHGVPFVVKDMIPVQGQKITFGSYLFKNRISDADAVVVQRIKKAGAILIGITNMPEFAHKATNDSPLYGITRNPWNTQFTPGGSSGGSAAAVCIGAGGFGIGTDSAGSIRIPASCCGLVGLKGTQGMVPYEEAPDTFGNLSVIGPLTHTVADAYLIEHIMSGKDTHDALSYGADRIGHVRPPRENLEGVRVLWAPKIGNELIDEEVLQLTKQSIRQLESMGASIDEMSLDLGVSADLLFVIKSSANYAKFGEYLKTSANEFDSSFRQSIERGAYVTGAELQTAIFERTNLFRRIQDLFIKYDFIISPSLSAPALSVDQKAWDPVRIGNRYGRSARYEWFSYAHPFNNAGNPAVSIPCGWTKAGMPVGLQIAGRWYAESEILSMAAELEAAQPWQTRHPSLY